MENLATKLAKLLVKWKVNKEIQSDPDLKSTVDNIEWHIDYLEQHLDDFCKRNPESNACKKKRNWK